MNLLLAGEETQRLKFRKLLPSDYHDWIPFHQDSKSSEFFGNRNFTLNKTGKIYLKSKPDRSKFGMDKSEFCFGLGHHYTSSKLGL